MSKKKKSLKQIKNRILLKKVINALPKSQKNYEIRGFVKQNGLDK